MRKKTNTMAHINENYLKLAAGYLFPEIGRRVKTFAAANPQADIIRLGIGDVVKGIPRPIIDAMKDAVEEMAYDASFQGYPPDQGQEWLRQAIVDHDFAPRGVKIDIGVVFVFYIYIIIQFLVFCIQFIQCCCLHTSMIS